MMKNLAGHPEFSFHHIGVATKNLESEIDFFRMLGYELHGRIFVDDLQGIEGCFMTGGGPKIELVRDINDSKTVAGLLSKQITLYHIAYRVLSLSTAVAFTKNSRGRVVRYPLRATAFEGESVMFVVFRNNVLIEFIGVDDLAIDSHMVTP